jgi:hypothetical protein
VRDGFRRSILLVLIVAVFCLNFGFNPIYTGNQNSHCLRGVAQGTDDHLRGDWLVETADPFPVFTILIRFILAAWNETGIYFMLFPLLGLYIHGLWKIPLRLFPPLSREFRFLFLVMLFIMHNRSLGFISDRLTGINLVWFVQSGIAGLSLLSPYLQPSVFGVLWISSILAFLSGRTRLAAVLCGFSTLVHFNYLLASITLLCAFTFVVTRGRNESGSRRRALELWAFSLPFLFLSAAYMWCNFRPSSPETFRQAQEILYFIRLPHHADPGTWFGAGAVIKLAIVSLGIFLSRRTPICWMLIFPAVASLILLAIQVVSGSIVLGNLYPWRLFVFLVPLAVSIILHRIVLGLERMLSGRHIVHVKAVLIAAIVLLVAGGTVGIIRQFSFAIVTPDYGVIRHVRENRRAGECYFIPPGLENFRLNAGVPVFIDLKNLPFRDVEVLEWYRRLGYARGFYADKDVVKDEMNEELMRLGITHVVLPRGRDPHPSWKKTFSDDNFSLYLAAAAMLTFPRKTGPAESQRSRLLLSRMEKQ